MTMMRNGLKHVLQHRIVRLSLVGLALCLSGVLFWPSLSIQNHLTHFFPQPEKASERVLMETLKHTLATPLNQQPIMLALSTRQSSQLNQPLAQTVLAKASQQLTSDLQTQPWVKKVENHSQSWLSVQDAPLRAYRYLLSDISLSQLPEQIQTLWQAWQLGVVVNKQNLVSDPAQSWMHYLQASNMQQDLLSVQGVWMVPSPHQIPNKTSDAPVSYQALVLVTLNDKGITQTQALNRFQQWLSAFSQQSAQQGIEVRYSSAATIAQQAKHAIQQQVTQLSIAATALILGFLLWVFRRPLWVGLSFVPLLIATWVSTLLVNWLFGSVEALTLAIGVVLIGVTVDYPIHAFSSLRKSPAQAWAAWPIIRLGGLTSAAGFLSLAWLGVVGMQQIAVFASVGILTALMVTRVLMAELSPKIIPQATTADDTQAVKSFAFWQAISPRWLWGLAFLAVVFLVLRPIQWQDDLASLSPVPRALLQQDQSLRLAFQQTEASQFILVQAPSLEALLEKQEALAPELAKLQFSGVMSGFLGLSNWLPSEKMQQQRQQALPTTVELVQKIQQANTPLTEKVLAPFLSAVESSRQLSLLDLNRFSHLALSWQTDLLPFLVSDSADSTQWTGKILLRGVKDSKALNHWCQQHEVLYFNQREFVASAVKQLREGLMQLIFALTAIFLLVLWIRHRRLTPAWQILFPVGLGILLTFVSLSVLAGTLTVFHLLAGLLLIAIGIDYSLFARNARAMKGDMASVQVALATTVISFGLLLTTTIPILIAIGQTLVVGVLWIYLVSRLYHRV